MIKARIIKVVMNAVSFMLFELAALLLSVLLGLVTEQHFPPDQDYTVSGTSVRKLTPRSFVRDAFQYSFSLGLLAGILVALYTARPLTSGFLVILFHMKHIYWGRRELAGTDSVDAFGILRAAINPPENVDPGGFVGINKFSVIPIMILLGYMTSNVIVHGFRYQFSRLIASPSKSDN